MYENQFSPIGQTATVLLIAVMAMMAVVNIGRGEVPHPDAFFVVLFGFALFMIAKLSVVGWRKWVTFGPGLMSPNMADLYRIGYWVMAVGILATFTGW